MEKKSTLKGIVPCWSDHSFSTVIWLSNCGNVTVPLLSHTALLTNQIWGLFQLSYVGVCHQWLQVYRPFSLADGRVWEGEHSGYRMADEFSNLPTEAHSEGHSTLQVSYNLMYYAFKPLHICKRILKRVCNTHSSSINISFWIWHQHWTPCTSTTVVVV